MSNILISQCGINKVISYLSSYLNEYQQQRARIKLPQWGINKVLSSSPLHKNVAQLWTDFPDNHQSAGACFYSLLVCEWEKLGATRETAGGANTPEEAPQKKNHHRRRRRHEMTSLKELQSDYVTVCSSQIWWHHVYSLKQSFGPLLQTC